MSRTEALALAIACLLVAALLIWVSPPPPQQTQSREALSESQGRRTGGIPRRFASLDFETDAPSQTIPQSLDLGQRLAAVHRRNPDFNHREFLQGRLPTRDGNVETRSPLSSRSVKLKMQLLTLRNNQAALQKLQDFAITCASTMCRLEGKLNPSTPLPMLTQTIKKGWPTENSDQAVPAVYIQSFSGPESGRISLYVSENLDALLPDQTKDG